MSKKSIAWGIILILLAAYLVISRLGLMPGIPMGKIIFTIIFGYTAIRGIMKVDFMQITMSLGILGWVYDDVLGIEAITPWIILLSAFLLGLGLNIIFKRKTMHIDISYDSNNPNHRYMEFKTEKKEECTEIYDDGGFISCENVFGSTNKYVNTTEFTGADIENVFGQTIVYFDNAVMKNGEATVNVENVFGETRLYFPKEWRIELREDKVFGSISCNGMCRTDINAPVVKVKAECVFGSIKIFLN